MTALSGEALVGELEQRFRVTLCLTHTDRDRDRQMAEDVYQGLVMGIFFSSGVENGA